MALLYALFVSGDLYHYNSSNNNNNHYIQRPEQIGYIAWGEASVCAPFVIINTVGYGKNVDELTP